MYHLAMAIAKELDARFIPMNCREPKNQDENCMFLGGYERIKAVFSKAEKNVPCLIFLKDIDAIVENCRLERPLIDELNISMEKRREGVFVVASTSRVDLLNVYIYGKFFARLEIDPFTFSSRKWSRF
jgi:AAA+ superfamily predicted ATPase